MQIEEVSTLQPKDDLREEPSTMETLNVSILLRCTLGMLDNIDLHRRLHLLTYIISRSKNLQSAWSEPMTCLSRLGHLHACAGSATLEA